MRTLEDVQSRMVAGRGEQGTGKDGKGSISRSDSSVGAVKSAVLLHGSITIANVPHIYFSKL